MYESKRQETKRAESKKEDRDRKKLETSPISYITNYKVRRFLEDKMETWSYIMKQDAINRGSANPISPKSGNMVSGSTKRGGAKPRTQS